VNEDLVDNLSKIIKALSSPLRLRIVLLLLRYEKLSVSDLVDKTGEAQSLISHHLSVLREAGIVKVEEKGRYRYYSIDKERMKEVAKELILGILDKKTRETILDFLIDLLSNKVGSEVQKDGECGS